MDSKYSEIEPVEMEVLEDSDYISSHNSCKDGDCEI